ncbi:MAG: hypothetical protein H0V67_05165 [Geodermatophilaceae bacterium]|nr:hypothetical protein [Geodermatophilaceae bacterium]
MSDTSPSAEPASPVHPRNGAPDRLALAEFDAGLPDETGVAQAAAHVAGCAQCQAVLSGLGAARASLQLLAGTPIPRAVADRIAAALAAEAATADPPRTEAERESTPGSATGFGAVASVEATGGHRPAEVIELRSARRVRRLRVAAALAAAIVVVGGGGYVLTAPGGGEDSATSAEGAGDVAQDNGAESGGGQALARYDRQSLEAAVGDLLAAGTGSGSEGGSPRTAGGGEEVAPGGGVDQDCLASIPVATAEALSITRAIYEDQVAIVVLFAADPGRVQVTVLADCVDGTESAVVVAFDAAR